MVPHERHKSEPRCKDPRFLWILGLGNMLLNMVRIVVDIRVR